MSVANHEDARYQKVDPDTGEPVDTVFLDGWVDLNQDGDFDDPDEHVAAHSENPSEWDADQKSVHIPVPFPATQRVWYYSRWRLTYGHPNLLSGYAYFGEVEDHLVIPEPATLAVLIGGVALLGRRRRRRK